MKKSFLTTIAVLLGILTAFADNISVPGVSIVQGETTNVGISLENTATNLVSFQMDLTLPDGITINKPGCSLSSRFTDEDQELTIGKQAANVYRLTSTSFALTPISGTSGEIITLSLSASASSTGGTATLSNIRFVTSQSERFTLDDTSFNITVGTPSPAITFSDAAVKALCVANWDTNHDGELSEDEAAVVTDLGEVFKGNTDITSFDELAYFTGLTSIGDNAFNGCNSLASVTFPNSLTSIGNNAFENCTGLTNVTIPNSVTNIGSNPFKKCSGLIAIVVEEGNVNYDSRNNCNAIIETATNKLVSGCKNTIIPEGITTIGGWAFSFCTDLTSMTIPDGVTDIQIAAFENCYALTSVAIPHGVTNIGGWAFSYCNNLPSVNIPNSVTSIGILAFNNCHSLTSIVIPNSVTYLGEAVFQDCNNLTTVKVDIDNPLTIDANAFSNRNNATLYVPYRCSEAYEGAAYWQEFMEIVEMPAPVAAPTFDPAAGTYTGTQKVTITAEGAIKTDIIPLNCFNDCEAGGIPAGFYVLFGEEERTAESGGYGSGPRMFDFGAGGDFKKGLYFREGYVQFGSIEGYPLTLEEGKKYNIRFNTAQWKDNGTICRFEILNEYEERVFVQMINNTPNMNGGTGAVNGSALTEISFTPESTGNYLIRWSAATSEDGGYGFNEILLANVHVFTIDGPVIFYTTNGTNPNLESDIYVTPLTIESNTTVKAIAVVGNDKSDVATAEFTIISPAITFADDAVKALCVANWDTNGNGELSEAEAAAVTTLGEVFKGNTEISSFNELQYFTGLTEIGNSAFLDCTSLSDIAFPEGVTRIGDWALSNTAITSLTIPNTIEEVAFHGFYGCKQLTSLYIGNGLSAMGWKAFSTCPALTQITVSGDNQNYCSPEESNCVIETATNTLVVGCKSTTIPSFVTSIATVAFEGCWELTTMSLPDGLEVIGDGSFSWCLSLQSIIIPASVDVIEQGAFDNCGSLTSVIVENETPIAIGETTFSNRSNATLYVPYGSKGAYEAADYWKDFNIVEMAAPIAVLPEGTVLRWGTEQAWDMKYMYFEEISEENTPPTDGEGRSWYEIDFDDNGWSTLTGPIGRNSTDFSNVNTIWERGGSCYYLRRTFELDNVNEQGYYFLTKQDDNIKVWINGNLVIESVYDGRYQTCHIPASAFVTGTNTLAIYLDDCGGGDAYLDYSMGRLFYLKNVETGKYLNAGNEYGMHAVLADEPLPVSISQLADGSYTIFFPVGSQFQQMLYRSDATNVYVDYNKDFENASPYWTITDAGNGSYYIQTLTTHETYGQTSMPGTYLGNDPEKDGNINDVNGNVVEGKNITWTLEPFNPARTQTQIDQLGELISTAQGLNLDTSEAEAVLNNSESIYLEMFVATQKLQEQINNEYNAINGKVQELNLVIACANAVDVNTDEAQAVADNPANMDAVMNAISTLRAAYIARLGEGIDNNLLPLDVTGVIANPSFFNDNADGWNCDNETPQFQSYNNAEYYQKTFDIYQVLSGLPNGNYVLRVKGFHRPGGDQDVYSDYQQGIDNGSAELYANSAAVILNNQASGAQETQLIANDDDWRIVSYNDVTKYVPGSMHGARSAFDAGLYENELPVTVSDGTLTLGIRLDESVGEGWVIFDDFRLEFLQSADALHNQLTMADITGIAGGVTNLPISLENEDCIGDIQFNLHLPDGIDVNSVNGNLKVSYSDRLSGLTCDLSYKDSEGCYKVLIYGLGTSVTGNSGNIMTISLSISNELGLGDCLLEISDIVLTKEDGTKIKPNNTQSTLTLVSAESGDTNKDGDVDVADIRCIANYILGRPNNAFSEQAADANGDGEIDVADIRTIANRILHGNMSSMRRMLETQKEPQ